MAWWRHQMETFSALLAICAGNSPVTGEFPAQRPVTRSFDVFFDLRPNKRLSKQWWGWWIETPSSPLWRHCNQWMTGKGHNFKLPYYLTSIQWGMLPGDKYWIFILVPSHASQIVATYLKIKYLKLKSKRTLCSNVQWQGPKTTVPPVGAHAPSLDLWMHQW